MFRVHAAELTAREVKAQTRKTRGLFAFMGKKTPYKPTYNYQADGSACRVYGTLLIKKVTGTLVSFFPSSPLLKEFWF